MSRAYQFCKIEYRNIVRNIGETRDYLLARDDKSFHFVSNFGGFRVCSPNGTRSSTRKDEKTKIDNRRDRSKGFLLDRSSSRLSPPPLLFFSFPLPSLPSCRTDPSSRGRCTRVSFAELRSGTMLLVYERDPRVVGLRLEDRIVDPAGPILHTDGSDGTEEEKKGREISSFDVFSPPLFLLTDTLPKMLQHLIVRSPLRLPFFLFLLPFAFPSLLLLLLVLRSRKGGRQVPWKKERLKFLRIVNCDREHRKDFTSFAFRGIIIITYRSIVNRHALTILLVSVCREKAGRFYIGNEIVNNNLFLFNVVCSYFKDGWIERYLLIVNRMTYPLSKKFNTNHPIE